MKPAPPASRDQDLAPDPGWTQKVDREFRGGNSGTRWRAGQNRATKRCISHECERPSDEYTSTRLPTRARMHRECSLARPPSVARSPVNILISGPERP